MNASANQPSKILLDECFDSQDERFLDVLREFTDYGELKFFAQKWAEDKRPWSRQQIAEYLRGTQNLPGHEVVFKRLFKHFQYAEDHEMMAHFMVATDRLVRRSRIQSYRFDWRENQTWHEERLFAKPNKSDGGVGGQARTAVNPFTGETVQVPSRKLSNKPGNRIFTGATRNHLRRRIWRYFRYLSHKSPEQYRQALAVALPLYTDADLVTGENILDNWSLMHCCYFHHKSLTFTADHTNLVEGASLGSLSASPYNPEVWQDTAAFGLLVDVLLAAGSTLVRLWAIEMLRQMHAERIQEVDIEILLQMLSHSDVRVQEFGAELFRNHAQLSSLELDVWLRIVHESDPSVLPILCDAIRQHVSVERLSNEQLIDLCSARPASVAQLGYEFAQARHEHQPFTNTQLLPLVTPKCEQLAEELATWAVEIVGTAERYNVDCQVEFFDSPVDSVRSVAMDWLLRKESPGFGDAALWVRLIETPYDDVRLRMIDFLEKRVADPGLGATQLAMVWSSIILNIQRGNRTKLKAVRQVAEAIAQDPSRADQLMPVVSVAVRSIRGPEKRNALSALVGIAVGNPILKAKVNEYLPELEWIGDADA